MAVRNNKKKTIYPNELAVKLLIGDVITTRLKEQTLGGSLNINTQMLTMGNLLRYN